MLRCAMRAFRLVIASLALVAVGCGEADVVSRSEVERQTQKGLTKSVGQQAPPAKCPKSLKAEVGATTRCTMDFPESKRLGITVWDGVDIFPLTADGRIARKDIYSSSGTPRVLEPT